MKAHCSRVSPVSEYPTARCRKAIIAKLPAMMRSRNEHQLGAVASAENFVAALLEIYWR